MSELKLDDVWIDLEYDPDPDLSYLEQTPAQLESITAAVANRRRIIAWQNSDWYTVGVRLKARVTLVREHRVGKEIALTTPGLWGVESDSGEDYFRSIADDELPWLVEDLAAFGLALPDDFDINDLEVRDD